MIFNKNRAGSWLAHMIVLALCGALVAGCSGGGSSGGGGGGTPSQTGTPGQPGNPGLPTTFTPVSKFTVTHDAVVNASQQVAVTINGLSGSPLPSVTIYEPNGIAPLGNATLKQGSSSVTINITITPRNPGDPDLVWSPLVKASNALSGQISEEQQNIHFTVKAPASGGGGGGGGAPVTAAPTISFVNDTGLQLESNHDSPQLVEVSGNFSGIDSSNMHWRLQGSNTDLPFVRDLDGSVRVAIPKGTSAANLYLTVDGKTNPSNGLALPFGSTSSRFVLVKHNNPTAPSGTVSERSRFAIFQIQAVTGAVVKTYDGTPNGFVFIDADARPNAGERMVVGNEGNKAILLAFNNAGVAPKAPVDITTGVDNATASHASALMTSWGGQRVGVLWRNPLVAGGNWQVSVYKDDLGARERLIDTGISRLNDLKPLTKVRWMRTNHVLQTYMVFGDHTTNKVVAIGMRDGDVAEIGIGFNPDVCSQVIVRNDVHNFSLVVAGDNGAGNIVYSFIQFGLLNMVSDPVANLRSTITGKKLIGVGYYYDKPLAKEYLVYAIDGHFNFAVRNITDGVDFTANLKVDAGTGTTFSVNRFAFIPGKGVAVTSRLGYKGHIIVIPVAGFTSQAAFNGYRDDHDILTTEVIQSITGVNGNQFSCEVRAGSSGGGDRFLVYVMGDKVPRTANFATKRDYVTNEHVIRGDRSRVTTVRQQ